MIITKMICDYCRKEITTDSVSVKENSLLIKNFGESKVELLKNPNIQIDFHPECVNNYIRDLFKKANSNKPAPLEKESEDSEKEDTVTV